jgi:hypothetical protein
MADFGAWLAAALSVICMVPIRHLLRNIFYTSDGGAGRLSLRSRVVRGPHRRAPGNFARAEGIANPVHNAICSELVPNTRLVAVYLHAVAPRWHMTDQ